MTRLAVLALILAAVLAAGPARAQQVLVEEANEAIEIKITVDQRAVEVPVLFETIKTDAAALADEYRAYAREDHAERGNEPHWSAHYLDAFYEVTFLTGEIASVISTRSTFTGGVHGNQDYIVINLALPGGDSVGFDDLFGEFSANSEAFATIQGYVRERLAFERAERLGIPDMPPEDQDWIREGTETPQTLANFTLMEGDTPGRAKGLMVFFPPYQVGSYAEGPYTVEVPALVFTDLVTAKYAPLFD